MKFKGFTLAEVLLTLAVIGIVAAITLPSLLVDTTEKAFDAQRRALHARLSQAIGMMSSLSGYGTYMEETKEGAGDGKDNAAETFLYEGLSKVYKINNICDSDNLDKCGIPASITTMAGTTMDFPKKLSDLNWRLVMNWAPVESENQYTDTKTAAFETINGESIAVFYNPNCKNDSTAFTIEDEWGKQFYAHNKMCVNFIYDLNGLKGPNKVGKDIGFITAIGAKNPEVVAPIALNLVEKTGPQETHQKAVEFCQNYSDGGRLPNRFEGMAFFYNKNIIYGKESMPSAIWTSKISSEKAWVMNTVYGNISLGNTSEAGGVQCIAK